MCHGEQDIKIVELWESSQSQALRVRLAIMCYHDNYDYELAIIIWSSILNLKKVRSSKESL